jgi:glycine betaine transporter
LPLLNTILRFFRTLPIGFWLPGSVVFALCLAAVWNSEALSAQVHEVNMWILSLFGDFYLWFVWISLLAFVLLPLTPLGSIRLGGPQAKPVHSFWSWFAMLFCAGMGTGFMFWGSAEPLYHYMNPPLADVVARPAREALALRYTFFHWGVSPWAVYGMTALAIGFWGYNLKQGFCFSSFLLEPDEAGRAKSPRPWLTGAIDFVTTIAIVFGIAATLGMGILQIESGLARMFGWVPSPGLTVGILTAITIAFLTSALMGLEKGIKTLSTSSMWLSFLLLALIIAMGPIHAMLNGFMTVFPEYITSLGKMSLGMGNFHDDAWVGVWTVKYWSWWIAWAPFVGLFIALISKGRTVRELTFGVMIVPTMFSCLWFTAFGETAIRLQQKYQLFGASLELEQVSTVLYQILSQMEGTTFLAWLSLILIAINFINSADSATYTISTLSQGGRQGHPPLSLQLMWGVLFSLLAGLLLLSGGIEVLQEVTAVTVLPFTFLLVVIFGVMLVRMVQYYREHRAVEATRSAQDPEGTLKKVS